MAQLLNQNGGEPFSADDEHCLREFPGSIGVILESRRRMGEAWGVCSGS